ncbi:unnamed protein product [Dimorphilus gyrociliatus]|uniref:Peptidase metallopeptidase domain-containing protein n=1 Tax=Dimorphilus gyrociliatus TaxID=2664684 RepID=A0A7I8W847_9ANNE|nr:unnamed protein product [Dimorphilus gyrociliatus]
MAKSFIALSMAVLAVSISSLPTPKKLSKFSLDDAEVYLEKFYDYHLPSNEANSYRKNPLKDENFIAALKEMQRFAGLQQTGKLDDETIDKIKNGKRCGLPDKQSKKSLLNYSLHSEKWNKKHLTYYIRPNQMPSKMTKTEVHETIARALKVWSDVTELTFEEKFNIPLSEEYKVDLVIFFAKRQHGDENPFDGPSNVLAHAFLPSQFSKLSGDAHFDNDEEFTYKSFDGINLFQVAAHEFGHSLGLEHSDNQNALMAPYFNGYQSDFKLHSDDIAGIQALYGEKKVDATTKPSIETTTAPSSTVSLKTAKEGESTDMPCTCPTQVPSTIEPVTPEAPDTPADVCQDAKIDTILQAYDDSIYAFKGNYYWTISVYYFENPKKISDNWKGLPGNLDASFYYEKTDTTYFFKGDKFWEFEGFNMKPDSPKIIGSDDFLGIPNNVDAAFIYSEDDHLYFIKDNNIYKYLFKRGKVANNYPKRLTDWRGLPEKVDAVFQLNSGYHYFFTNQEYYRFDENKFRTQPWFARDTGSWWFGC